MSDDRNVLKLLDEVVDDLKTQSLGTSSNISKLLVVRAVLVELGGLAEQQRELSERMLGEATALQEIAKLGLVKKKEVPTEDLVADAARRCGWSEDMNCAPWSYLENEVGRLKMDLLNSKADMVGLQADYRKLDAALRRKVDEEDV
jgi:hypothetical protein